MKEKNCFSLFLITPKRKRRFFIMSNVRRARRKDERTVKKHGGFAYTNPETGIQLQYTVDTKKVVTKTNDPELDKLTQYILGISTENETADKNKIKLYEYKVISLWDYVKLIQAGIININIKTNRPDVNKISKKQGIVATILKGNCLPCFCLCIRLLSILVNDGGHRSRTFVEFVQDEFSTHKDTYYINSKGKEVNIGGLKFSEILAQHPQIAERFKASKQKFDVYHHISPKEMTEEFQDRNQSSDTNFQEGKLNSLDLNVVAEFVRNITRIVEGENSNPHALFRTRDKEITIGDDALIGFEMSRLNWDELVSRLMCMIDASDEPFPNAGKPELLGLFQAGCEMDKGRFVSSPPVFDGLVGETKTILTDVANIMFYWPSSASKKVEVSKNNMLIIALFRFIFHLRYHYFEAAFDAVNKFRSENYPKGYVFHGIKCPKKFAKKFKKLMSSIFNKDDVNNPDHFKKWIEGKKLGKGRTVSNAFKGYLGKFDDPNRYEHTIKFMFDEFDNKFEDWGLDVRDAVREIPDDILNSRFHDNNEKCECCQRHIDGDNLKLEGAHNISHAAGVEAGGCSSIKENARASCFDCNRDSKERIFDEYKESGDWKKFLK